MGLKKPAVRFVVDVFVGAGVFFGLTVALLGPSNAAQLLKQGAVPAPLAALAGGNDPVALLAVFAVAFSALFALNLAFVRHVKAAEARARAPRSRPLSED